MVYNGLILWVFFAGLVCFCRSGIVNFTYNKKIFLFMTFSVMALVYGLRADTVGVDTHTYHMIFDKVSATPFSEIVQSYYFDSIEVGYAFLMRVVSEFGGYNLFQTVQGLLICGLFANFIKDNADNYFLECILFLGLDSYLLSFNIARQMLAAVLIANCWSSLRLNKPFKALLFMLCAGMMHTTAWIFVIFFIIPFLKKYKMFMRCLPAAGVITIFSYETILARFAQLVPHYANYYKNQKTLLTVGTKAVVWMIIVAVAVMLIMQNIKMPEDVSTQKRRSRFKPFLSFSMETYLYAGFSLCYVAANVAGLSFNYLERLGCYFIPFVMITFERFGMQIKTTTIRRIYYCGLAACFIMYFMLSSHTSQYQYNFFWKA